MSANELVDLNSANAAQLMSLPGIGPGLAARIIAYRTEHPIHTAAQLAAIPGISPRMADELVSLVLLVNSSENIEEGVAAAVEPEAELTEAAGDDAEAEDASGEALAAVADWRSAALDAVGLGLAESEPEDAGSSTPTGERFEETAAEEVESTRSTLEALPLYGDPEDEPTPPEPEFEPEIEIEPDTSSPEQTAPPAANLANDIPALLQLTGCRGTMVALFGGAIFGTLLTLVLLFIFNGGLRFAGLDRVNNLADEQDSLQDEFRALEGELATAQSAQADLEENLQDAEAEQGDLQATLAIMETRVENVGPAAERLDTFILGMREFLNELATPPRPTMTPLATPTEAVEDATTTAVPAGATRTPRPTSTPIATSTP